MRGHLAPEAAPTGIGLITCFEQMHHVQAARDYAVATTRQSADL